MSNTKHSHQSYEGPCNDGIDQGSIVLTGNMRIMTGVCGSLSAGLIIMLAIVGGR